jgi:putative restriction endonuclease
MIGEIPGVPVGTTFVYRRSLHDAGIHRGLRQSIGAAGESIVLSGGYVDDVDDDETIIYTGEGGRDINTGRQNADQTLTRGNLALMRNYQEGNPIRVCRGYKLYSPYAPTAGYRYDGLYRIESCFLDTERDGYKVWRYRLLRIPRAEQLVSSQVTPAPAGEQPVRSTVYTTRVIRNSEVGNQVRSLYHHTCQISGDRLETSNGPYAEACYIRPVGRPHNGPDIVGNVLCLSPNMHVLFDLGAITLSDDFSVIGKGVQLHVSPRHNLSLECIRYHREHIYCGD